MWSGRFSEGMDPDTLGFTTSIGVDRWLAFHDAMGSIAHAKMLGECGIIPAGDAEAIVGGLREIAKEIMDGAFEPGDEVEDIHSAIEVALTERIGPVGGKLHTARSRNDQVATDLKMYATDAVLDVMSSLVELIAALTEKASEHAGDVMPGFTHLQHAQPVTLGHHLMAHAFRLESDLNMFMSMMPMLSVCPLGSAALAGTTFPIDREMTSDALGFVEPSQNSMHAVADRDFVLEALHRMSMTMLHLSSLSEELVLWSSPEFGFVEIADAYSTGSSIMPQKKNPDIAELIRGRSGAVAGNMLSMTMTVKGLPLTYNRDMQEDKKPLLESFSVTVGCLEMAAAMISTCEFDVERMKSVSEDGFLNATDLADYLVTKGVPFREAHGIVGAIVRECIERKCRIEDLPLDALRKHSESIGKDVFDILPVEKCVERRNSFGGTSPESVRAQIEYMESSVELGRAYVDDAVSEREALWEALLG